MENITIGQIVGSIGQIGVLSGFCIGIYKFIKNTVLDKIANNAKDISTLKVDMQKEIETLKADTQKEIEILKERTNEQDKEIQESKEERLILLKGLLACLKGLKEQGCNGPVTQAINDIENYIVKKSHD